MKCKFIDYDHRSNTINTWNTVYDRKQVNIFHLFDDEQLHEGIPNEQIRIAGLSARLSSIAPCPTKKETTEAHDTGADFKKLM